jgi:hypothetical protein
MSNAKATKSQIKTLKLRIETLKAELVHPFTEQCGEAAKKCIREDIATWEAELARVA